MLNFFSFRAKLVVVWIGIQILITGIFAFCIIEYVTDSIEKDIIYQADLTKPILNSALVTPLLQRDYASVSSILKELIHSKNIQQISIKTDNNLIANASFEPNEDFKNLTSPYTIEFPIKVNEILLGTATVDISRDRLVEVKSQILTYIFSISFGALLIFAAISIVVSRLITKPINDLSSIANLISKGNFNNITFTKRNDEIGVLQNAFQSMGSEISRRIHDLNLLNAELEDRVEDRTKNLRELSAELSKKVEQLELLSSVVQKSNIGIAIIECNRLDHNVIYINSAYTKLTGYSFEDISSNKNNSVLHKINDEAAKNSIYLALQNQTPASVEFLDSHKDGRKFWNHLSINPVSLKTNAEVCFVLFINDITLFKNLTLERENLLIEMQENQRLRSLGLMVASLAHEVNNPLGIAITATTHTSQMASSLRKNLSPTTNQELIDYLDDEETALNLIYENLKRASELVISFKDVAIVRTNIKIEPINLNNYFNTIHLSLTPTLKRSGCSFSYDIDPRINLKIDTGSFNQVVTNIILNATIHAFEGISDKKISVTATQDTNHVSISIADNGNGIPQNVMTNLFTPFYSTKRNTGGSGLGLFISKQITTDILNGSLEVQNLPNRGCEFKITLPN